MGKLKPGDRVVCKVRSGQVVNAYANDWDEKYTFEIVATDSKGYYVYIPHYISIKGGTKITEYNRKSFGIDKKFLDELVLFISENSIIKIESRMDGLVCDKCKEFYSMANTENLIFICWVCRNYPSYR